MSICLLFLVLVVDQLGCFYRFSLVSCQLLVANYLVYFCYCLLFCIKVVFLDQVACFKLVFVVVQCCFLIHNLFSRMAVLCSLRTKTTPILGPSLGLSQNGVFYGPPVSKLVQSYQFLLSPCLFFLSVFSQNARIMPFGLIFEEQKCQKRVHFEWLTFGPSYG